jgi:hypothetical protein
VGLICVEWLTQGPLVEHSLFVAIA